MLPSGTHLLVGIFPDAKNVRYNPGGHWWGYTQILRGIQGCFSSTLGQVVFFVTICDPFPDGSGLSDV